MPCGVSSGLQARGVLPVTKYCMSHRLGHIKSKNTIGTASTGATFLLLDFRQED